MSAMPYQDSGIYGWDTTTDDYGVVGYYPDPSTSSGGYNTSGIDFGNFGSIAASIAGTLANTWSAKTLMQQNQNGQRYIEGQRLAALQAQSIGGLSPMLLLLIGGGVLLFVSLNK